MEGPSDHKLEMNTEVLEPTEVVTSNHLSRTKGLKGEVSDDGNLRRTFSTTLQESEATLAICQTQVVQAHSIKTERPYPLSRQPPPKFTQQTK